MPEMPIPLGHRQESAIVGAGHHRARREQRQVEKEPAVQRDLYDLARVGHRSQSGRFGLHADDARLDIHRRGGFAQFELDVDARALIHFHS